MKQTFTVAYRPTARPLNRTLLARMLQRLAREIEGSDFVPDKERGDHPNDFPPRFFLTAHLTKEENEESRIILEETQ